MQKKNLWDLLLLKEMDNQSSWGFAELIEGQSWGAGPFRMPVFEGPLKNFDYPKISLKQNLSFFSPKRRKKQ